MVHRLNAACSQHLGRPTAALFNWKNAGSQMLSYLSGRKSGDFTNPCRLRPNDVRGGVPHRSPGPLWLSIRIDPASGRAAFYYSLICLLLDPVRGKLGAHNIRQDAPSAQLRRWFSSRYFRRGGCTLVRGGALDQIAPVDGGPGGRLMPEGREQTFPTKVLVRIAFGCRGCVRRLWPSTFYFDRKRRPCRSMAHLMYSSCKSVGRRTVVLWQITPEA